MGIRFGPSAGWGGRRTRWLRARARHRVIATLAWGMTAALLVAVAAAGGAFADVELVLYDIRARECQFGVPEPTDKLVHVDIDDPAVDRSALGRYPWPRERWARVLSVLADAKPRAVALDVLFDLPEDEYWEADPERAGGYVRKEGDVLLAAAFERLGSVVLAYAPEESLAVTRSAVWRRVVGELQRTPELEKEALLAKFADPAERMVADAAFQQARRVALGTVAEARLRNGATNEQVIRELGGAKTERGGYERAVATAVQVAAGRLALERLSGGVLAPGRVRMGRSLTTVLTPVPLPMFSAVARGAGFVKYDLDPDGRVRTMPTVRDVDGRLRVGLGVALACAYVGVSQKEVSVSDDGRWLTLAGASDVGERGRAVPPVPMESRQLLGSVERLVPTAWFGKSWQTMYERPGRTPQRISIIKAWNIAELGERVVKNAKELREAMLGVSQQLTDQTELRRLLEMPAPTLESAGVWLETGRKFMAAHADEAAAVKSLPADATEAEKVLAASFAVIPRLVQLTPEVMEQREGLRRELASIVGGKAVLIGFTATGLMDRVPTPIGPETPGVVVHGLVFNSVIRGSYCRRVDDAWGYAACGLLGLAVTLAATRLGPLGSVGSVVAIAAGYTVVNAVWVFGYRQQHLWLAAPVCATLAAGAACTVQRFIADIAERRRITRRFQSYVDPKIVEFVIRHPEEDALSAHTREMSVVFTDLAGFTTFAEQLREQTVPVLNEYFGRMVPIIRRRGGSSIKFLGDGMMFFFNPPPDPRADHAAAAVETVMEMQAALHDFRAWLAERELPLLTMRAGITTGEVVVGDAGPRDASDYTVLGDVVNLASRLESANKATGTSVLVTEEVVTQLPAGRYLVRPLGAVMVVGKTVGVRAYEVMCPMEQADERMKALAEATTEVEAAFSAGRPATCMAALEELEQRFGVSKLTRLYRDSIAASGWRAGEGGMDAAPAGFNAMLVLTEK